MHRPWLTIPIAHKSEPLIVIPSQFFLLEPHPYLSLGAPYSKNTTPWMLRGEVVKRLAAAQTKLQDINPNLKLAIFDAWRPIAVQSFMLEYAIKSEFSLRGLDIHDEESFDKRQHAIRDVKKFWAPPSNDPNSPPPHSTGGAVDLTIAKQNGELLNMGGEIDAVGPISHPEYYSIDGARDGNSDFFIFDKNRKLLAKIMCHAGFTQHPNEWWHFSYGDQLWAWSNNFMEAIYGAVEVDSNLFTASSPSSTI